jgi:hypothetical protein
LSSAAQGGSDEAENLVPLSKSCHDKVDHDGLVMV